MFAKLTKAGFLFLGLAAASGTAMQAGQPAHYHHGGHSHDGYGIPGGGYGHYPSHQHHHHGGYPAGGYGGHSGHHGSYHSGPYRW